MASGEFENLEKMVFILFYWCVIGSRGGPWEMESSLSLFRLCQQPPFPSSIRTFFQMKTTFFSYNFSRLLSYFCSEMRGNRRFLFEGQKINWKEKKRLFVWFIKISDEQLFQRKEHSIFDTDCTSVDTKF